MANKKLISKLKIFSLIIALIFAMLEGRLFYLQIVKADTYETLAEKNKFRIVSIPARRGNIYDRDMDVLATSKPVFTVSIASPNITDKEKVAHNLAEILRDPEITQESILQSIEEHYRRYEPIVVKRLPYEEGLQTVSRIEEHREELPGVMISEEPMREYPFGHLAGHILGTVGLINKNELDILEEYNYRMDDWIGKTGLEKTFERYEDKSKEIGLRGKAGADQVEVDAKHRPVSTWSHKDPVPGNSLVLTLDQNLQKVMEDTMAETIAKIQEQRPKAKAGAGVLIDVRTGAILAMASYPFLNPNDFANGLAKEKTSYYWDDKLKPTFNRAISAAYPPGSTFKMVTGIAALSLGNIDPKATVYCSPSNWTAPRAKCHKIHGAVNLYSALGVSCNTYFQEMGYRVGPEALTKTAGELGFGQKTGIELPAEVEGILPSRAWKEENFTGWEHTWRSYDTFYMSMGQGYNLYTPLQLANFVATIANGGKRMKPYLVDKIVSPNGEILKEFAPQELNKLSASPEVLAEVRKGMRAVAEPGGTAYSIFREFPSSVKVAAKTGTAQTGLPGDDKNKDYHGLFVAFAPYENPQVAFAGIVEYGYHGGSSAGLVAKAVFEEYFGLKKEPIPDELPDSME
ncbi:MAG: penicillin-binding protein 2 [Bacillota bacterium]